MIEQAIAFAIYCACGCAVLTCLHRLGYRVEIFSIDEDDDDDDDDDEPHWKPRFGVYSGN